MTTPGRPVLRVYVSPGCLGCPTAVRIAAAVRHARPQQPVEVVDLAEWPTEPLPDGVIGTPTYELGGHIISMGNPGLADLLALLDSVPRGKMDM